MLAIPAAAAAPPKASGAHAVLHTSSVNSMVQLLAPSFNPNAAVGGVPFCPSGSLGTILCYTPSFLKTAYNFPSGLDGAGSTIVIVDAFGSPTIQADLDVFDTTFGLPAATVTILCGPTWTGSPSDHCPVNTISDLSTAPNAALCGAPGWAEETSLDVTMAHGLAPGAKVVLVVANDCFDSSIYTAEQAVVNQHTYDGSIMSQSFGEPDDLATCTALDPTNSYCIAYDPTLLNQPNQAFQTAFQHRWTVIASTGDSGANTDATVLGSVELTPSFPSTSPLVLAAGGTQGNPYGGDYGSFPGPGGTLSCAAGATCDTGLVVVNGGANGCGTAARPGVPTSCYATGYGGEGAWNEWITLGGAASTGGGISSLYSRPSWQVHDASTVTTLLGAQVPVTGRTTPDVSFNSAAQGGFLAYLGFLGVWGVFSGTSASSPAWAGIVALLNQAGHHPAGFVNTAIYKLGAQMSSSHGPGSSNPFHDITTGNNSVTAGQYGIDGFLATTGYDLTTGWGTPNVSVFLAAMVQLGQ
jgi:subtilase family serine protease